MNVLVTGSTGFIGSHLCQALLQQGNQVRAFHRPTSILKLLDGLQVEHATGDLTQPATLLAAMDGIEVVFHVGAWMGGHDQPGREYTVTVEGTRNVLNAAREAGVKRVVHTSSVAALGVPKSSGPQEARLPINENHTWNFRPHWYPYGYAKYLAEQEVQKAVAQGQDVVIVNPTLVFGAGDLYRQSNSIVTQVAQRKISVAIDGGINTVDVEDVVLGHLAALSQGQSGERYILGNENMTFLELLRCIADVTGSPPPNLILPTRLIRALSYPAHWLRSYLDLPVDSEMLHMAGYYFYYDLQKARQDLNWQAQRPVKDALASAWKWFKELTPDFAHHPV